MNVNSAILCNSSFVGSTAANGASIVQWQGGRSVLSVVGTAYGTGLYLQTLGADNQTWINMNVNGSSLTVNTFTEIPTIRGQYKIVNNASSSIGIYAALCSIPPT